MLPTRLDNRVRTRDAAATAPPHDHRVVVHDRFLVQFGTLHNITLVGHLRLIRLHTPLNGLLQLLQFAFLQLFAPLLQRLDHRLAQLTPPAVPILQVGIYQHFTGAASATANLTLPQSIRRRGTLHRVNLPQTFVQQYLLADDRPDLLRFVRVDRDAIRHERRVVHEGRLQLKVALLLVVLAGLDRRVGELGRRRQRVRPLFLLLRAGRSHRLVLLLRNAQLLARLDVVDFDVLVGTVTVRKSPLDRLLTFIYRDVLLGRDDVHLGHLDRCRRFGRLVVAVGRRLLLLYDLDRYGGCAVGWGWLAIHFRR
uniref:(northern house mosquito) hypothetical protein n=1 Tax=Culex pipiens TaxID=7175 RepID=A0A8D8FKH1_CULPI